MPRNQKENVNLADELLEETAPKEERGSNEVAPKQRERKTVVIKLPLNKYLKEDLWVGVNGKKYLIKRGVDVEVPVGVAKVIRRMEKAELAALEYDEEMAAPEDL